MKPVHLVFSALLFLGVNPDLIAENPGSFWTVTQVKNPKNFTTASGFKPCRSTRWPSNSDCTLWEMFHQNDTNRSYPFYFSRLDTKYSNFYGKSCASQKLIKDTMIQTTNNALSIQAGDENGVLFDGTSKLVNVRISIPCTGFTCDEGSTFGIEAAYEGFLPPGFGGSQGIKNAVEPVLEDCQNESTNKSIKGLAIGLGVIGGVVGIFIISVVSWHFYDKRKKRLHYFHF